MRKIFTFLFAALMSAASMRAQTETLLTTITATAKEQASYSTANVATVSFSYTAGGSSDYHALWGWWGYGWSATVNAAEGYTITKCVFYDDANRTATDSEAPFVVETTEEDKTPKVNGTPILEWTSKGIKKIDVYGYATPTTYTLQLVADPEKGSVAVTNLLGSDIIDNGNGNYTVPANAEVTILATPIEGYEFSGWKAGDISCDFLDCGVALNTEDNPYTFTMTADVAYLAEFEAEPEVQGVVTLILANLPEENRPATIELAGTFDEGTAELEKLDTGWFIYKFIHASADATGKFRDKTNPNMVLCEFIPANGDEEGKWVQAIFKISDYGSWDEDGWKGTACMWTEIDVTGEQYAWMENAPEPLPTGFENIVLTEKAQKVVVDGMIYIVRDGKLFNMTGAQVK